MNDCVATAPTPASAHVTPPPTAKACDWTATPSSPVFASRAMIENVCTGRRGTGASGPADRARGASRTRANEAAARRRMEAPFGESLQLGPQRPDHPLREPLHGRAP